MTPIFDLTHNTDHGFFKVKFLKTVCILIILGLIDV